MAVEDWRAEPSTTPGGRPPEGFAKAEQLEAFAVALDQVERHGGDATNLLVEVVWAADGISYEVAEFPPGAG